MNLQIVLEILALLIPLIHVAGMLFAAHAILYARTSQGAVAWALSLVFFPYVSILLYLVFGRQKFHGYIEARRKGDRHIDHLADNLAASLAPARANFGPENVHLDVFNHLTLLPFTAGNSAELLVDGTQTFDAIFEAIESARHYLLVQFFIFRDDGLGRKLRERLSKKAEEGVRVFILYDEIGCIRLPGSYFGDLRKNNVRAYAFNTSRGWRNRFQINFRNHRKIVVADGRVAFVGGHNVGDEYLGLAKRFGRWRDTHVKISGPAVAAVQWAFIEDWHWATGEVLEAGLIAPAIAPAKVEPTATASSEDEFAVTNGTTTIVIPSSPADQIETCTLTFLAAISAAKKRLWITSPYFVPDEPVYDALQLAAIRGVDVRIMLPSRPDHLLVYLSAFSYLESAEKVGVKFYRYQAGFLHQKVMLIDDHLAAVGTANLDNRSMRLNFELTVFFADKAFAAKVAKMLEEDFAACERATPGDLGRRSVFFRIAVRIARLLSPVQ